MALAALGVLGTRNAIVILDETVYQATWEVIVGLRDSSNSTAYIGGYLDVPNNEDFTYMGRDSTDLPFDCVSKLVQHYAVTRADSNKHCFCVDLLPRKPKKVSSVSSAGGVDMVLMVFECFCLFLNAYITYPRKRNQKERLAAILFVPVCFA